MLLLKEILTSLKECALWDKSYDFSTCNTQSSVLSTTAHLVKSLMQRSHIDIRDVHRHLCDAVFIDKPADGFCSLQSTGLHNDLTVLIQFLLSCNRISLTYRSALLPDIKCDGIGTTGGSTVQVIVHCNKEVACTDSSTTGTCHLLVKRTCSEIRSLFLVVHSFCKSFILSLSAYCKILSFRLQSCCLIAITWN